MHTPRRYCSRRLAAADVSGCVSRLEAARGFCVCAAAGMLGFDVLQTCRLSPSRRVCAYLPIDPGSLGLQCTFARGESIHLKEVD